MQNRRILDRNFAEAGVTVTPLVETDTVSAIFAHAGRMPLSSVISHAWLYLFGVPEGMRVVPLQRPRQSYQVGLVLADRDPEPMLARALLDIAHRVDMSGELDGELDGAVRRHLQTPQPEG